MTGSLDIRTISAVTSFINLIICLIMFYVYQTRKTYQGFSQWVYTAFLVFVGMLLMSMRNVFPEFATTIIANAMIASSFATLIYGIHLFYEKNIHLGYFTTPVVFMIPAFLYFTYLSPDTEMRIILISVVGFLYFSIGVHCVYVKFKEDIYGTNLLLVFFLLFQALFFLFRIISTLLMEKGNPDFMAGSIVQAIFFLALIGGNTGLFLGLIIVNFQRVERELIESHTEIKLLKGILPICSHCKKVRDDKGYWNQIEAYIQSHSEAEFSHSICRECAEKYYPKMDIYGDDDS